MTAKKTGMRSPLFSKHGANALSQKQNKECEHHSGHYEIQVHGTTSSAPFAARADFAARLAAAFGLAHTNRAEAVEAAAACFII